MASENQGTGKGYCGSILHVDLGASTISHDELDDSLGLKDQKPFRPAFRQVRPVVLLNGDRFEMPE